MLFVLGRSLPKPICGLHTYTNERETVDYFIRNMSTLVEFIYACLPFREAENGQDGQWKRSHKFPRTLYLLIHRYCFLVTINIWIGDNAFRNRKLCIDIMIMIILNEISFLSNGQHELTSLSELNINTDMYLTYLHSVLQILYNELFTRYSTSEALQTTHGLR